MWEQLHALQTPGEAAALMSTAWQSVVERTNDFVGRKVYQYFNWRQDTSKDLLVTFSVFSALVLVAGAVRRWAVDQPAERAVGNLWADVYQVSSTGAPQALLQTLPACVHMFTSNR